LAEAFILSDTRHKPRPTVFKLISSKPLRGELDELEKEPKLPGAAPTTDVSERLRVAEEALQRSERLAVASRYAGAVMHEVNNPLEALTNLVFITKQSVHDPQTVLKSMELAESQLRRLGEITRKTLSFYREQSEAKEFDLVEIAESALQIHAHRASRQNITVHMETDGPAYAQIYATEILQVLSNLIINSYDALPEKGGTVCLRVKNRAGKIHITIADNGKGIEPHIYKNIFQAHNTSKNTGTGLGLWLSHGIAKKHQGSMSCRSSVTQGKRGTTFRLSLPASKQKIEESGLKLVKA
jgi:signal transduction histidine kinase